MDSTDTSTDKTNVDVTPASIVNLKAELYRKQQEYEQQKSLSNSLYEGNFIKGRKLTKKKTMWTGKNTGVKSRSEADEKDGHFIDIDKLEASRAALEAKSKLYEKMASEGDNAEDEDGNSLYLVDFEKKFIDKAMEHRRSRFDNAMISPKTATTSNHDEDIIERLPDDVDNVPEDEQWVDFTDSLGRSRRCMKRDLPKLQSMDRNMKTQGSLTNQHLDGESSASQQPDLMSADMHREMLREKWEREQREMLDNQDTVHYSNVQFDDRRSHGVGYYQFSKDEEERQKEIDRLNKLREETKSNRDAKEKLKDKRKSQLAARLDKVRQRRLAQGKTVPEVPINDDTSSNDSTALTPPSSKDPDVEAATEGGEAATEDGEETPTKRKPSIREWDMGKPGLLIPLKPQKPKGWINPRDIRDDDFAPPSFYYQGSSQSQHPKSNIINTSKPRTDNPCSNPHTNTTLPAMSIPLPSESVSRQNHRQPNTSGSVEGIPLPPDNITSSRAGIDEMIRSLRQQQS